MPESTPFHDTAPPVDIFADVNLEDLVICAQVALASIPEGAPFTHDGFITAERAAVESVKRIFIDYVPAHRTPAEISPAVIVANEIREAINVKRESFLPKRMKSALDKPTDI